MKRVLLTGATGFIGRHAVPALLARGYEVHAVSSRTIDSLPRNYQIQQLDLFDFTQTTRLMAEIRPSHLLHFAWNVVPGKCWSSPENLDWVKASLHLLQQFAAHGGKRVVMAGTCAEYDWSTNEICNERTTLLTPATLYGTCKAALYKIVDAYTRQIGLSGAWGRIFYLYGPCEYSERLVPTVIQSLLRGEIARCSHGTQIRDFMYVEDVADAFAALLDSEVQGAINVASGQAVTLKEVINKIAGKLKAQEKVEFGAFSSSLPDPPSLLADVSRLSSELRWHPKYSLDSALDETIAWWKTQL